jgi:SAM-dependent methyltransferase
VQPGQWVLDFGGGTGLDLHWLAANKYKILFCEPSALMREKAIKSYSNTRDVIYLDSDKTDFTTWHKAPPFSQKVDAILADFGVINCIPDIDFLFRNLAVVIKPNGHFLAVFLDRSLKKMWSWHRRNAVRSLLFNSPFIMYVQHREHRQTVFVHSIEEVKRASAKYFDCAGHESLGNSGFVLIHLIMK